VLARLILSDSCLTAINLSLDVRDKTARFRAEIYH